LTTLSSKVQVLIVMFIAFIVMLSLMFSGRIVILPFDDTIDVDAENYIVHITDLHIGALSDGYGFRGGGNADALETLVYEINVLSPQPMFVMVTGDIAAAGGGIAGLNNLNWAKQILDRLNSPYYVCIGNHDYFFTTQNPKVYSDVNFKAVFGESLDYQLQFTQNNVTVKLVVINTGVDAFEDVTILAPEGTGVTDSQIDYIKDALLDDTSDYRIIATHHPIVDLNDNGDECITNNRGEFKDVCFRRNVTAVLSGHTHENALFNAFGVEWQEGDGTAYVQTENSPAYTIVKLDGPVEFERRIAGEQYELGNQTDMEPISNVNISGVE